ncbi:hypothetical protein LX15_006060 [Streptoalloteichus tenebrarius]|uniref:Uncharacterized protein n=1 Tax=Streptoalloteichus tenebrarius (strain ATCC 17920 / DSM 40477 / JCM 4838 / CBS 697.72 / NBRC 16177 / NCIMB 11028 / NRRL B-12390 / A12253. 1 / ISP 5477) TaxID=1933 RepID=A0ABT1I3J5_STRSD|nr:hypothetical protein [Streptoalloteichus tenebrarius]MCP2262324.1 hypothetical protein [Streptoalloteichus tenebrarius]BFF02218.1 hypothetical protein GCM10020241_38930 [Streptoalloteichus tenebrarius]
MADNAERLLAEALRAQAVTGGGAAPANQPAPSEEEPPAPAGLPARWLLLFAVLLGLAVGTVAGLISVL